MSEEEVLVDLADIEVTEPPAGWNPEESDDEIALDWDDDSDG